MTRQTTSSQRSKDILSELQSATTTNACTVQDLRLLLGDLSGCGKKQTTASLKSDVKKVTGLKREGVLQSTGTQANLRSQDTNAFEIYDIPEHKLNPLQVVARRKLATAAFNSTLKCLTSAVKARLDTISDAKASKLLQQDKPKATPLQSCSPNKQKKRPDRDCAKSHKSHNIGCVVDCATVALQCLMTAAENTSGSPGEEGLRKGALILVERLISLGLSQTACRELSSLYQLYERRQTVCHNPVTTNDTKPLILPPISLEAKILSKSDLDFAVNYHSQIMRLAISFGSDSVTTCFLENIRLSTAGSPARVVLHGYEDNLLEKEKAGQHLRTISQALLKLYSVCVTNKQSRTCQPSLTLELLVEALIIKCESWALLGHSADLRREFWMHLSKGLTYFKINCHAFDGDHFEFATKQAQVARSSLRKHDLDDAVPFDVAEAMADMAEASQSYTHGASVLREYIASTVSGGENRTALLIWRLATMQQKCSGLGERILTNTLEEASQTFAATARFETCQPEKIFLHGARLRKTAVAVLQVLSLRPSKSDSSRSEAGLSKHCLQILSGLSSLLHRSLTSLKPPVSAENWSLGLKNSAKTLEAIIEVSKDRAGLSMSKDYDEVLERAIQASKEVLQAAKKIIPGQDIIASVEKLHVKASHIYWLQYLAETEASSVRPDTLKCLDISISLLRDLSPKIRDSASYVMILEKLALSYLSQKDVHNACESFQSIVDHYIEYGTLEDAMKAFQLHSRLAEWLSKGTKIYSLAQALGSLVRLRLTYQLQCPLTGSWMFDIEDLSLTERTILFGLQMDAVESHSFSQKQTTACKEQFNTLLALHNQPGLDLSRFRFMSNFLRALSQSSSLSDSISFTTEQFSQYLDPKPHLTEQSIPSSIDVTRSFFRIQLSMQSVPVNLMRLKEYVQDFSSLILRLPDVTSVTSSIEDHEFVESQMRAVLDIGKMLDDTNLISACLLALKHISTVMGSKSKAKLADILTQLANLYDRVGKTTQASRLFADAKLLFDDGADGSIAQARWTLLYIDHLMGLGQVDNALNLYNQSMPSWKLEASSERVSGRHRFERELLVSKAAQIASRIGFHSGNLDLANRYARQGLRLSTELWLHVEGLQAQVDTPDTSTNEDSVHNITLELSNLTLSFNHPATDKSARGNMHWDCVDLHCSAIQNMIDLSTYSGLYQDALYYAEQLHKLTKSVRSNDRSYRAMTVLALIHSNAGHEAEANKFLRDCERPLVEPSSFENQWAKARQAEAWIELKNYANATSILDNIEQILSSTCPPCDRQESTEKGIRKAAVRGRKPPSKPIKKPAKRPGRQNTATADLRDTTTESRTTQTLQSVHDKRQALRLRIALEQGAAPPVSSQSCTGSEVAVQKIDMSVASVMAMLRQALVELSSDAVKCVLAESAVALPVRYRSGRKSGRVSFVQTADTAMIQKSVKAGRGTSVNITAASRSSLSSAENLIIDAQKLIHSLVENRGKACDSDVLHMAHKIQHQITLLSSTMNITPGATSSEIALQSLAPKDIIRAREYLTVNAERVMRAKAQVLAWPDMALVQDTRLYRTAFDCSTDELSSLPSTWSVISISLSEDRQELFMSKITSSRSPFLLRVPLSRSDLDVDQDNDFSFADAKAELLDVLAEANLSAHDSRGQGTRDERKAWYMEREALDLRLEHWLYSIENIWLGGFRGLMCSTQWDEELLSEFGQQLKQILDKHLPSRQKSCSKTGKVALHAHVVQLFLGLGHPDEQELDDAATDLLYFVIDILQFSGEHNAYDEIDFDAMLVDLFDAMRSCHERQPEISGHRPHMILVIDKELASFPWESLPCLRSQSVSRMLSLGSIFHRLKKLREQSLTTDGYSIPADQGAYILNPSSDLVSTQATFQPVLESQLQGFTSKINSPPTEPEFTSLLTTNSLVLYFGHGSGAQYIRGRTVRGLDSCAVTLLMGCSSAKMTECGKFESYGVPGYYIGGLSGCMAVVGTLWDVTDRDIDRFAMKLMLEWGLIDEGGDHNDHVTKVLEKSRWKASIRDNSNKRGRQPESRSGSGSGSEAQEQKRKGTVSLDEAVSRARDACLLPYLNGAAPVVYGVPVFLH